MGKLSKKIKEHFSVKVGSPEEVFWADVKDKTEKEISTLERLLKFNQAILEMCLSKIEDAQE